MQVLCERAGVIRLRADGRASPKQLSLNNEQVMKLSSPLLHSDNLTSLTSSFDIDIDIIDASVKLAFTQQSTSYEALLDRLAL